MLSDHFDLGFETATPYYRVPDGAPAWETFSTGFGPVKSLLAKLDDESGRRLQEDFVGFHEGYRNGAGVLVPRSSVITVGRRHG